MLCPLCAHPFTDDEIATIHTRGTMPAHDALSDTDDECPAGGVGFNDRPTLATLRLAIAIEALVSLQRPPTPKPR